MEKYNDLRVCEALLCKYRNKQNVETKQKLVRADKQQNEFQMYSKKNEATKRAEKDGNSKMCFLRVILTLYTIKVRSNWLQLSTDAFIGQALFIALSDSDKKKKC